MLKDNGHTEAPEDPEIGRLLARITQQSRDWAEAEARLARIELASLRAQAWRSVAFAGAAIAALLCMLVALTQAMIAGVKSMVEAEGLAALVVSLGLAMIVMLCVILARRSLAWRTESIFFRWFGSRRLRGGQLMGRDLDEALVEARRRRGLLLQSLSEARRRLSLPWLADQALRTVDPQFGFLVRLKKRLARNKLLALAVLAGAGWLAGSSVRRGGKSPGAPAARRDKPKEKNNDSGQHQRKQRTGTGAGQRRTRARAEDSAQARSTGEARTRRGLTQGGEPQRRAAGETGVEPQQRPVESVGQLRTPAGQFLPGP